MALIPWHNDPYVSNTHYGPTLEFYKDALEDYLDGYWPVNTLNTPLRDLRQSIQEDKRKVEIHIDVQQFKPEEISLKISGDNKSVVIEGKHDEKLDEHGFIFRHFVRKYSLPEDCDGGNVQSELSSDGVLTIIAPKFEEGKQLDYVREIPITKTGSLEAGERKRRMLKLKNKCHLL